ncbi:MAG: hypothetical protein ACQGVC_22600 [Myxococcota bacterium]
MSPVARRTLALAALLALAGIGTVSIRETRAQLTAMQACDAAASGDFARTLRLTEGLAGSGETARAAAECRCRALNAAGRDAECASLLGALAAGDPDYRPSPDLVALAARDLAARGHAEHAAALVRSVRRENARDPGLLALELDLRAAVEPEERVIESLARELPATGDAAAFGRALLARRQLRRGDAPGALRTLATPPADAGGEALAHWYDTKLTAHALDDDVAAARQARDAWQRAGGEPAVVRARYALALSIAGLADPDTPILALLARSLAETEGLAEKKLREGLAVRFILTLTNAGRFDEALSAFDRHQPELGLDGLSRDELLRAERREHLARAPAEARRGRLRFRIDGAAAGSELWLSPDADAPADAAYQRIPVPAGGEVAVTRSEGEIPQRWVLRRGDGVLASGTIQPRAGAERSVEVAAGSEAKPPAPPHVRTRRDADGRRRVALVLLDCGDWPIVNHLRARGELPVLDALRASGTRAVLTSDPPLTAAALEALVWPGRRGDASVLGLVHRMGVELAGLASVGDNPFEALRYVLPESDDLFSRVGTGDRSAANLLLSHGGIRAGRHGEVSGPHGAHGRVPIGRASRPLDAGERRLYPLLARAEQSSPRDALYVRTIAAELDATRDLAHQAEHDLVVVRIEPLDILTHANYAETATDGRDDGGRLLYDVYRYIDARLGEVDAALDADDVLIVMSDHGIRTAMEHSEDAFFVAVGPGIPPGRIDGTPHLRGVPRALAELLGIATDWPDTGIAGFARAALAAAGGSHEASGS